MKKPVKIVLIILAVFVVLGFVKNLVIKSTIEMAGSQVLGAPLRIGHLSVSFLRQSAFIKDLRVFNPPGFDQGTMVHLDEVGADFEPGSYLKNGTLHLRSVTLKLKEMTVVKNKEGKLNVDALKVAQQGKEQPKEGKTSDKKPAKQIPIQLDTVIMDLGQVVVKDYTVDPPTIVAHDIGVHGKTYKDIKSAQQLAMLVMMEAMGPAGLKSAAIYGAATVLGVAFLPAGVAGVLMSKDSAAHDYNADFDKVYNTLLEVIKKSGSVESENRANGIIKAKIDGAGVTVEVAKKDKQTSVKASARKMMLPKPEIANGLIYQLSQRIQ